MPRDTAMTRPAFRPDFLTEEAYQTIPIEGMFQPTVSVRSNEVTGFNRYYQLFEGIVNENAGEENSIPVSPKGLNENTDEWVDFFQNSGIRLPMDLLHVDSSSLVRDVGTARRDAHL